MRVEYRIAHPTVPPGIQRSECLTPAPQGETEKDNFLRRGGHITEHPHAKWEDNAYTTTDVAQGRDLDKYDKLQLRDAEHFHPWELAKNPILAQARTFIWGHWYSRRRAYLTLTLSSVDHTGTSHVFVEPDDGGRWRVYWRLLDGRELVDTPTNYWVSWVIPNGWDKPGTPLSQGHLPDPLLDQLEFRDVCGELSQAL